MTSTYFGEAWPSGICDDGTRVDTPVGVHCEYCDEPVQVFDQGSFVTALHGEDGQWVPRVAPVHRECSLRAVLGGIGHLTNHLKWCVEERDPDAGHSYRESSLLVWSHVADWGFPTREEP